MKAPLAVSPRQPLMPRNRWALLSALVVLVSIPFLVDLPSLVWHEGRRRSVLPTAATSVRLPDTAAVISIGKRGVLRFSSGEEMSLPVDENELELAVSYISSAYPERPFVLYIDRGTPYAKVAMVLAAMRKSGPHQVYFRTNRPS